MSKLDPRIEAVRVKYDLQATDFWELPQRKGTWVAKHSALEVVAVKADIVFAPPQIIEADTKSKIAVLAVEGRLGGRSEWATGEASPDNNKNAYPWAMAEKRAKDRVILKLAGIHGLVYSEDELSEPQKAPVSAPANETVTDTPDALDEALAAASGDPKRLSRNASRPIYGDFKEHLESLPSIEAIESFWSDPKFRQEFDLFPVSHQQFLESYKDALIKDFNDSVEWSSEIEGKLRACLTMEELKAVWSNNQERINKLLAADFQRAEEAKDQMKAALSKGPMPKFEEGK